jgi:hypothetical protein
LEDLGVDGKIILTWAIEEMGYWWDLVIVVWKL